MDRTECKLQIVINKRKSTFSYHYFIHLTHVNWKRHQSVVLFTNSSTMHKRGVIIFVSNTNTNCFTPLYSYKIYPVIGCYEIKQSDCTKICWFR